MALSYMRFAFLCPRRAPQSRAGYRVAVIGAGPAGLAAAGYLACRGYEVDVYDKQPYAGGLMIFGIPEWRIPRERVLDGVKELEEVFSVKFVLRTKVFEGEPRHDEGDELAEKKVNLSDVVENYHAVVITTGTWRSRHLKIPGWGARGAYTALDFVYKMRIYGLGFINEKPFMGKRVYIIGAGLSAVDAAYEALRLGADEVTIAYRRTVKQAPAGVYELDRLRRLGAKMMELVNPVEIIVEKNYVKGLKLQRMKLGAPDETGRPRPIPVPGSEFVVEADTVIAAVGEIPTPPVEGAEVLKKLGVEIDDRGRIVVYEGGRTRNPKIFAAGDVVSGPSKVGPAIGSGLAMARFLDRFLRAEGRAIAL